MKKPTSGTTDLTTGRPLTRILVFALPLVYCAAAWGSWLATASPPRRGMLWQANGKYRQTRPSSGASRRLPTWAKALQKNVHRPKFIIDFSRSLCGTAVFLYPLTKAVSLCYLMSG